MSSSKGVKSSKPFHKNSGDWFCADKSCNNLNFARRDSCNRCKKPREDAPKKKGNAIGTAAASSSKGLFSADDWQCSQCLNINWARRNQCNICNAKKYHEEDERTGLGGGFNEREKVEYKRRVSDSDDEYDEFGRRKKRPSKLKRPSESDSVKRKSRRQSSSSSSSSSSDSRSRHSSSSSSTSSSSSSRKSSPRRKRSRRSRTRSPVRERSKVEEKRRSESEAEEEEEDDDEDLSKYNLFDDDDIDIEALRAKK